MGFDTAAFRNFVLIGHGNSGKTTFLDAMAFKAGVESRQGSTDDGSSISDTEPEERKRNHTLASHLFHLPTKKNSFHIFDTPGYPDFLGDAVAAMQGVETAVVMVSNADGITFNAGKLWQEAGKANLARAVVVTKPDGENTDFYSLLEEITGAFGDVCVPVCYPDGNGKEFSKIFNVLAGEGDRADDFRSTLEERVVEVDEALMEKYFEEGELSDADLKKYLPLAMARGNVVPVFCAQPPKAIGVEEFLDFAGEYFPSPLDMNALMAFPGGDGEENQEATEEVVRSADGPLAAQVVKVVSDPHVGKLSFIRVWRGGFTNSDSLFNTRTGKNERIGQILNVHGKNRDQVEKVTAGQIVAVTKVDSLEFGDSVTEEGNQVKFVTVSMPPPTVSKAVSPKNRGDEQKVTAALQRMLAEDPAFVSEREPTTGELLIKGLSDLHLDVQIERIFNRFKVELETRIPKVPFQETIQNTAKGHHRHKKQSGGRGQFGEAYIEIFPRERGEGFEFVDAVVGGNIPRQFIPEVEKGVKEAMSKGIIAGYPVVDIGVKLYDGKFHPVDSDQLSFQMAGARALSEAFEKAKPTLLEPIMNLEIEVPSRFTGDITANLNTIRGRLTGMDSEGDIQTIKAEVPLKEAQGYYTSLRSITAGEGTFRMEFNHYEPMPGNLQQEIVAASKKED